MWLIVPGFRCDLKDTVLGQPEVIDPAANVGLRWPTLPPSGQGGIGRKAQRREQLCKEPIKIEIARNCVLLLLYWFT